MTFDFDELTDRRGSNSYKWDADPDVLPMFVADMDFRTAPAIVDALRRRVEHGIFGYTRVPDAYYASISRWFSRRHAWEVQKDWILYTSGVVPAISAVIKAFTRPGDGVAVLTPAYNCFFSSIRNNRCELVDVPLHYEGNRYTIDFGALEQALAGERTKVLLFCSPHNPAGRVWTREELERVGALCVRHGVRLVSDEIHCELVMPSHTFIPTASVNAELQAITTTLNSPSKAFNTAGLQIANIIDADADRRKAIDRALNDNEVCDVNPFGVLGLMAAYDEGEAWLEALNAYLYENYQTLCAQVRASLPQFPVVPLEGTYLVWLNVQSLPLSAEQICDYLRRVEKVWFNASEMYGGKGFLRINIACPRARLQDGLSRLIRGLQALVANPDLAR